MFDIQLPEFYQQNQMDNFFLTEINDLFDMKNNEYFSTDVLNEFIKFADDLENALLDYQTVQVQKVEYFNNLKKTFDENNDELRNLNDQLVVAKIQKRSFGKSVNKGSEGVIMNIEGLKK